MSPLSRVVVSGLWCTLQLVHGRIYNPIGVRVRRPIEITGRVIKATRTSACLRHGSKNLSGSLQGLFEFFFFLTKKQKLIQHDWCPKQPELFPTEQNDRNGVRVVVFDLTFTFTDIADGRKRPRRD